MLGELRGDGLEAVEALPAPRVRVRRAVRAVIERDGLLLMTYAVAVGDYGFPGGGIEEGETRDDALRRELREEIGAELLAVVGGLGVVVQRRPSHRPDADILEVVHEYVLCTVAEERHETRLEVYERELGLEPRWIDPGVALTTNRSVPGHLLPANPWIPREIFMLEWLASRRAASGSCGDFVHADGAEPATTPGDQERGGR